MSTNNWKSLVYKEKEVEYRLKVLPRGKVLKRDHYTCQSCRQRLPAYACQKPAAAFWHYPGGTSGDWHLHFHQ